ncbi:uncharacterized protein LOC132713839 [Ruditapes philippinarum]|uniref:uncharacterized protein LOC132713839 n=1 Tax=Ruditapes philippinarum TaxID=129788 RepID=UPI00295ADFC6|nr:uncharacterized protein LOC132713839 [Ruditapes philippinarum]
MDFIPNFSIVIILAVLLVQTDGATTNVTTVKTTVPSTVTTVKTVMSSSSKTVSSKVTTKHATKAPISCLTGSCVGEECSNNTVTAAFKSAICSKRVCLTLKTVTNGTTSQEFKCAVKDCASDQKTAPKGTTVSCCETKDCNKPVLEENSAASRIFNTFTAIMTVLLLYILI